jgi:hypothetical protein
MEDETCLAEQNRVYQWRFSPEKQLAGTETSSGNIPHPNTPTF